MKRVIQMATPALTYGKKDTEPIYKANHTEDCALVCLMMWSIYWTLPIFAGAIGATNGQTTGSSSSTVSTAVPSPTVSLNALLPSQVAPPPKQSWCPSDIFCPGAVSSSCCCPPRLINLMVMEVIANRECC